jgi:hypothetical protein
MWAEGACSDAERVNDRLNGTPESQSWADCPSLGDKRRRIAGASVEAPSAEARHADITAKCSIDARQGMRFGWPIVLRTGQGQVKSMPEVEQPAQHQVCLAGCMPA